MAARIITDPKQQELLARATLWTALADLVGEIIDFIKAKRRGSI